MLSSRGILQYGARTILYIRIHNFGSSTFKQVKVFKLFNTFWIIFVLKIRKSV